MSDSNNKVVAYSILGVSVAVFGTIIVMLAMAVLKPDQPIQSLAVAVPPQIDIAAAVEDDPVEWTWLERVEPKWGTIKPSYVATSRPVTWAEVVEFANEQLSGDYYDGIKFGVYFDERYGKKQLASSRWCYNLFFHSGHDLDRTTVDQIEVERSPAAKRFLVWESEQMENTVWDASYESGELSFSTTSLRATWSDDRARTIQSVPEIWWKLYLDHFWIAGSNTLIEQFYDINSIEIQIFNKPGGSKIATFTAPRSAIEFAFLSSPYDGIDAADFFGLKMEIDNNFAAGAITEDERDQILHQWAINKMDHFRQWFVGLAEHGARLEVDDSISREVPFGWVPE